jgi:amidase
MPGDRFTAGDTGSFTEAARTAPGRLRIGWSTKPVTLGVRPDPTHVEAVRATARLLTEIGHDVREVDPRYPDPTLAFVPQFFAGIRDEAALVEHPERLERRTRETVRLGSWVTPGILERAIAAGEQVSVKANRVFDTVDVLLTPTTAHRPPRVGVVDGLGTVRSALRAMPAIAYCALWNVAGNPAANVPAGLAPDGLPLGVQLVGRGNDETTLLSLSAQLEEARPWASPRL